MKNYNAVLTLVSDINKVFAHVTEDEDKIEPSDLIVLNKYMYRFINSIEVQPWLLQTGDTIATSNPSTKNMYAWFKLQRKELNN
jgi:hypothetical protein